MLRRRPDRRPRPGRGGRDDRRHFRTHTAHDRLLTIRWVIVGVWFALLVVRVVVVSRAPDTDLAVFGVVEGISVVLGLAVIGVAIHRGVLLRRRHEDEALGAAIRRVDPTVWLLEASPTQELRDALTTGRPDDLVLGPRATWAFGATEASLWELDDRKATRVLVIRWTRVVHVGVEVDQERGAAPAVVFHYVRPDDTTAVAAFHVRTGPGSRRFVGTGARLDALVRRLAAERIVG